MRRKVRPLFFILSTANALHHAGSGQFRQVGAVRATGHVIHIHVVVIAGGVIVDHIFSEKRNAVAVPVVPVPLL
jgi:hypothetical protein